MTSPPGSSGPGLLTPPEPSSLPPHAGKRLARLGDVVFKGICQGAALLIIGVAALLLVVLVWKAWEAITTLGPQFLVGQRWDPEPTHRIFGAWPFIWGTVRTSAIAMVIAVPLGVGTAAFLSEIAPAWVRRGGSFLVEMLAAIPSVVYGFWGLAVLAPLLEEIIAFLGGVPQGGLGILSAGLILSIMIVPYVAAVSYDVCRAVPHSQRAAALALGATRWQMIWSTVLPYARPGIVGGCFLALGRALGETMAVTMLIGNKAQVSNSLLDPGNSIASVIANEFQEATYELYLSALVALGLVLLLVTVIVNSLARLLIWRIGRVAHTGSAAPSTWGWIVSLGSRALLPLCLFLVAAWLVEPLVMANLGPLGDWPTALPAVNVVLVGVVVLAGVLAVRELLGRLPRDGRWRRQLGWALLGLSAAATLGSLALILWRSLAPAEGDFAPALSNEELGIVVTAGGVICATFLLWRFTRNAGRINALMTAVLALCLVVTAGCLLVILAYLIYMGVGALNWDFFTKLPAPVGEAGGGFANAIYGSFLIVGLATLFAVPVGLLAAIYLAEYRRTRLGPTVRFIGELLGGVPSIVIGLFVYALVVRPMGHFSGWAGALALAVMMIPIVMRASEEALKLVPEALRQASHALGATQWQTVVRVIVPAALPAIITAVFLAIARVAGETAPLLLTAFGNRFWPNSPNEPTPSLPVFIYLYAISPYDDWHQQAWAGALVLLVIIMGLNFGIRVATGKRVLSASRAD
jgi:phosphate transport system permease protein